MCGENNDSKYSNTTKPPLKSILLSFAIVPTSSASDINNCSMIAGLDQFAILH